MSLKTATLAALALAIGSAPLPTTRADDPPPRKEKTARKPSIVATAAAAGTFRTLVNAIVAADLFDALKDDGPFTVLAPTDEAFAKVPDDTRDDRFPVDGGTFAVLDANQTTLVPIHPSLAVRSPTLFAVTLEPPGAWSTRIASGSC